MVNRFDLGQAHPRPRLAASCRRRFRRRIGQHVRNFPLVRRRSVVVCCDIMVLGASAEKEKRLSDVVETRFFTADLATAV